MNQQIPLILAEPASAPATTSLPLKGLGTTYSMAQAVRWLDERSFAIGRWDGTLTIFRRRQEQASAPVITAALVVPSVAGVEMIAQIKEMLFASSNDAKSIVVWCADTAIETGIRLKGTLTYHETIGVANDGTTRAGNRSLFRLRSC